MEYIRSTILNGEDLYTIDYILHFKLTSTPRKILCLHGGGGNGYTFSLQSGMDSLTKEDATYTFEFIDAPYPNTYVNSEGETNTLQQGLWLDDGKAESPMTYSGHAINSINYIESYIQEHGPFYGILGYSQGTAIILSYLAYVLNNKANKMFTKVMLYNGYSPVYNNDLVENINFAQPLIQNTMIFTAVNDFTYDTSIVLNTYFSKSVTIVSNIAGHDLPTQDDPTYNDCIEFIFQE